MTKGIEEVCREHEPEAFRGENILANGKVHVPGSRFVERLGIRTTVNTRQRSAEGVEHRRRVGKNIDPGAAGGWITVGADAAGSRYAAAPTGLADESGTHASSE